MLVVACNSATSHSVPELARFLRIPVEGVIEPGARSALAVTGTKRIGVIGTQATVRSHAYREALLALDDSCQVVERPCPLFVPLAEEGWLEGDVTAAVAETYLAPLRDAGIDVCILGCTHYPLLRETIERTLGAEIATVDSASATAETEISVEVRPQKLAEYDLSFMDVAEAIAASNLDLPGGQVRTARSNCRRADTRREGPRRGTL